MIKWKNYKHNKYCFELFDTVYSVCHKYLFHNDLVTVRVSNCMTVKYGVVILTNQRCLVYRVFGFYKWWTRKGFLFFLRTVDYILIKDKTKDSNV